LDDTRPSIADLDLCSKLKENLPEQDTFVKILSNDYNKALNEIIIEDIEEAKFHALKCAEWQVWSLNVRLQVCESESCEVMGE
jgi:hypothetical protein